MKILLWCDDLINRVRLESAWKTAGATVLKKNSTEVPDLVVVDLQARNACEHIAQLRQKHAQAGIIAFGPHFDAEAFEAAKAAGATEIAAQGSIVERVMRRLRE
ncbi:hypothetical protein [Azoarcus sp. KH32C]|uniref:hypothetical protein n=1 Tax=Azoarcus sp. KH32C TaxID=748247 RepID=UPI00023863C1|nr:hypothetical protein [Azoarcus sp. KH32C]BAL24122.1 hypothetical protein AZKH_1809 [Azoarcus sp. KH32C]